MKDLQPINFPGLDPRRPLVIAGPCSAETEEQVIETARELAAEGVRIFRAGLWKPRTKPGGFEGVGAEGVAWLRRVKRETGMYTATEVATRKHVIAALEGGIDMIWIGARTTANPFAMQEIADALRGHDIPVLVKNPVSPDLELWIGGVERIYNAGIRRLGVIHRGFTSIDKSLYRNHPMWSIHIELHRRLPGLQIFCDPSHIGGRRELIAPLSQQAMDLGFDGLIVEAHCSPDCAWSDKAQQVTPQGLAYICRSLVIREANTTTESLSELRSQIDKIDDELLELLVRRMRVSRDIGQYKKEHNMPILQAKRYEDLLALRMPFLIDSAVYETASALRRGDEIVAINDAQGLEYPAYREYLKAHAGEDVTLTVKREGDMLLELVVPVSDEGRLGVTALNPYKLRTQKYTFWQAIPAGISKAGKVMSSYWEQLKMIVQPKTKMYEELGGFIAIGSIFPGDWNWEDFWMKTAFLSIILAVMNILPIPGLDGGHAIFTFWEMITGRKVSDKILEGAQYVGLFIILLLLLYANGNDIYRFFIK